MARCAHPGPTGPRCATRSGPAEATAKDRLWTDAGIGCKAFDRLAGDGVTKDALDLAQELQLIHAHERDRVTVDAGSAGAADAMDVVLGNHR